MVGTSQRDSHGSQKSRDRNRLSDSGLDRERNYFVIIVRSLDTLERLVGDSQIGVFLGVEEVALKMVMELGLIIL